MGNWIPNRLAVKKNLNNWLLQKKKKLAATLSGFRYEGSTAPTFSAAKSFSLRWRTSGARTRMTICPCFSMCGACLMPPSVLLSVSGGRKARGVTAAAARNDKKNQSDHLELKFALRQLGRFWQDTHLAVDGDRAIDRLIGDIAQIPRM